MSVKIEIPKTLADYSIHQAENVMTYFTQKEDDHDWKIKDMIELISIVSGVDIKDLRRVDIDSLKSAYNLISNAIKTPRKEPVPEITINGVTYCFDKNMGKDWHGGRFVDAENTRAGENYPEEFAAICYIEKGKAYDDTEMEQRKQIFLDHFPGDLYIDLVTFFLQKFKRLSAGYSVLQIARAQIAASKASALLKTQRAG